MLRSIISDKLTGKAALADRTALAAYWIAACLVFVIAVAGALFLIQRDYRNAFRAAGQSNLVLATALAEHTTQVFVKLEALAHAVAEDQSAPLVPRAMLSEVMKRRAAAEPAARSISIADASGRLIATSSEQLRPGMDVSDDYPYAPDGPDAPRFHLSLAYRVSLTAEQHNWVMNYTHRIVGPDGRYAGFVLIQMDASELYGFYDTIPNVADKVMGLIGEDGVIRISNYPEVVGLSVPLNYLRSLDPKEGIQVRQSITKRDERIFGYSRSTAAPLIAYVGTTTASVRQQWLPLPIFAGLALLGLGTALAIVGIVLGKYVRSRSELLQRSVEVERQRQEREFLEAILNTGGAMVAVTDASGNLVVTNPAFREVVLGGYDGKVSILEHALGEDLDDVIRSLPYETTNSLADGSGRRRELAWTVTAIRAEASVRNLVAIGFDNTERREAELAIYQSGKLITLGEMATGLAHEINQPLGTIVLTLDHLRARIDSGKADEGFVQEHLHVMSEQAERASAIVEHMRIFSRRNSGQAQPLDPVVALDGALTIAGKQIENAGIALLRRYAPGRFQVLAEQTAVEQILINLLVNARDAILERREKEGSRGDETIELEVLRQPDGPRIGISVRDTGTGIAPELAERLFEPFFTTKAAGKGTGLGLALSYGMAKDFGGEIQAKNVENGAKFVLWLPEFVQQAEKIQSRQMDGELGR